MAAKRGLGKGLDSLIAPKAPAKGEAAVPAASNETAKDTAGSVINVPIDEVEPNREQPRKHFEETALRELADSIAQHGILQPLLVCRRSDYYEIIAGERRWRAAKLAKQKTVPVLVREATGRERSELALVENIQREDLNPIEEARAYQRLIEEYHLKQDEVARRVSKSRTAVTNTLRLLKLDERVQQMLSEQRISSGHARALLSEQKKERQYELALEIEEKGLSVREVEALLQKKKDAAAKSSGNRQTSRTKEQRDAVYAKIADRLRDRLGTKVKITEEDGKGTIEISYYSPEELERILDILES